MFSRRGVRAVHDCGSVAAMLLQVVRKLTSVRMCECSSGWTYRKFVIHVCSTGLKSKMGPLMVKWKSGVDEIDQTRSRNANLGGIVKFYVYLYCLLHGRPDSCFNSTTPRVVVVASLGHCYVIKLITVSLCFLLG